MPTWVWIEDNFASIIALVALLVGAPISILIARMQISASSCTAQKQIAASVATAHRQIDSTLATTHKQIIGPMRQAWINSLRDAIAEFVSRCNICHIAGAGAVKATHEEILQLGCLKVKIRLMLNMTEGDHQDLCAFLAKLGEYAVKRNEKEKFGLALEGVNRLSSRILKTEWDRVKSGN